MDVLHLISSSGFFGAEAVVCNIVKALQGGKSRSAAAGLIVSTGQDRLQIAGEFRRRGIEPVEFSCTSRMDAAVIRKLRAFVLDQGVHFVHSHGYKADIYSLAACRGIPLFHVATCHNWIEDSVLLRVYSAVDRVSLRWFDKVVAVSANVGERLRQSGIRPNRLERIPNGIDLEEYGGRNARSRLRSELGIDASAIVIGTVGRLSPEKGQEVLIRAFADRGRTLKNAVLLVVGDGPDRRRLEQEYGSECVRFLGYRDDVAEVMEAMDIFALPSLTEGLPLALLEAMAAGLPVVATRVGDVPSVIEEGICGFVVDRGDPGGLGRALRRMTSDPALCASMGEAGRRIVESRYSVKAMGERYAALYRSLESDASSLRQ